VRAVLKESRVADGKNVLSACDSDVQRRLSGTLEGLRTEEPCRIKVTGDATQTDNLGNAAFPDLVSPLLLWATIDTAEASYRSSSSSSRSSAASAAAAAEQQQQQQQTMAIALRFS
jgi:hypothetical protein